MDGRMKGQPRRQKSGYEHAYTRWLTQKKMSESRIDHTSLLETEDSEDVLSFLYESQDSGNVTSSSIRTEAPSEVVKSATNFERDCTEAFCGQRLKQERDGSESFLERCCERKLIHSVQDTDPDSPEEREMPILEAQYQVNEGRSSPPSLDAMPVLNSNGHDPQTAMPDSSQKELPTFEFQSERELASANTVSSTTTLMVFVDQDSEAEKGPESNSEASPVASDDLLSDGNMDRSPEAGESRPYDQKSLVLCKGRVLDGDNSPGFSLRESCEISSVEGESSRPMLSPQEPGSVNSEGVGANISDPVGGDSQDPNLSDEDLTKLSPESPFLEAMSADSPPVLEESPSPRPDSTDEDALPMEAASESASRREAPQLEDHSSVVLPKLIPLHTFSKRRSAESFSDESPDSASSALPVLTPLCTWSNHESADVPSDLSPDSSSAVLPELSPLCSLSRSRSARFEESPNLYHVVRSELNSTDLLPNGKSADGESGGTRKSPLKLLLRLASSSKCSTERFAVKANVHAESQEEGCPSHQRRGEMHLESEVTSRTPSRHNIPALSPMKTRGLKGRKRKRYTEFYTEDIDLEDSDDSFYPAARLQRTKKHKRAPGKRAREVMCLACGQSHPLRHCAVVQSVNEDKKDFVEECMQLHRLEAKILQVMKGLSDVNSNFEVSPGSVKFYNLLQLVEQQVPMTIQKDLSRLAARFETLSLQESCESMQPVVVVQRGSGWRLAKLQSAVCALLSRPENGLRGKILKSSPSELEMYLDEIILSNAF